MRLIDADVLIEEIKNMSQRYCDCKDCDGRGQIIRVSEVIDIAKNEVPTAYDVDKVVMELESRICTIDEDDVEIAMRNKHFRTAIEIVKQGGVSDDVCEWKQSERFRGMETFKTGCCGRTMILTSLEVANIKDCPQYAMKYCPYCGKKINVVE